MILVNIPLIIAWFMMFNSKSLNEIFIANILLGLGCGLIESPVITYVGEIWYNSNISLNLLQLLRIVRSFHHFSEPEFRSFLMAYTYVGATFGALFVSILNTLMPFRMVAFICIFLPIVTMIILFLVSNSEHLFHYSLCKV